MMMGQNKIKIKENGENGVVGASKRRSTAEVDHWAFLEEIEAPMWADLTLEPNFIAEDKDDAWFCASHLFHHLSARRLRSAFAHPDMGNDFLNFNPQGVCSPKLPSSVSKSRGKDYTSKSWRNNARISPSKSHPVNDLGGKISRVDMAPIQDSEPKISLEMHHKVSGSISSEICSDSRATTVSNNSQIAADDAGISGALNSQSASTSGVSTSTITTLSEKQDSKFSEVSKEAFGVTGNLLNDLRNNLRKSRAARPASRVALCDDRGSKGRKSSSGKSSVGSSTSIGYYGKGKRCSILTKTDSLDQMKTDKNANMKLKGNNNSTEQLCSAISIPTLEAKKMAAGFKQNLSETSGARGPGNLSKPMKEVIASKHSGRQPVKKVVDSLKLREHKTFNVRDLRKLAPPAKGRGIDQKLVEASAKTRSACISKIEGRGATPASTSLKAAKPKALLSENATNRPRLGAPGVGGKVGCGQLNESSCSTKEKMKRVALSRISSGKYNMPVVRTLNQKIPKKLSENRGSIACVGSKVNTGRLDNSKLSSDPPVYFR